MNKLGILEGLLFVVGDEGLTLSQICDILAISNDEAKALLIKLKESYETDERGIRISFLGDAFKLTTKKEHREYYQKLIQNPETNQLSDAALETIAIIAYHQPITRVEIDSLRGVATSPIIRRLVAKGLVKEMGKSTMPGRPNLYGTTHEFLDYFGLGSLDDLPELPHNKEESKDETELFTSIYKEN
jgi:segregation and condensation protein B